MRKKRGKKKTLDPVGEDETLGVNNKEGKGFFACYLLTSLSPRHKGHSYIGFTVNPKRRIRQHNGEITCGAWRTKKKRPWEMVLCIYGFPTNVSALQFEWAWQHPRESLAVREAAAAIKSLSGLAGKIKLAYTMLTLPAWNSLNLTVNYFSTKYAHHGGLCPSLPSHMKVQVCAMDDLPCFTKLDNNSQPENEESPDDNEEKEEDDSSNQSQPENSSPSSSNEVYPGEKELQELNVEKVKEPEIVTCEDRLASFTGFGLLDDESDEDEVSHVGTIEAMEKDGWRRSSSNDLYPGERELEDRHFEKGKEAETVFDEDRLANFTGFVSVDDEIVENEVSHSTLGSTEAVEKDCWKRSNLVTTTKTTDELEVIDLLTPSPRCRVGSSMKRRRVSEFIDLTMSPNFIEL